MLTIHNRAKLVVTLNSMESNSATNTTPASTMRPRIHSCLAFLTMPTLMFRMALTTLKAY